MLPASYLKETMMSVVKVIELSSESTQGYDNAVRQAVERAARTIRNIRSVWVKEFEAAAENDQVNPVPGQCEDLVPARRGNERRLNSLPHPFTLLGRSPGHGSHVHRHLLADVSSILARSTLCSARLIGQECGRSTWG
jgi:flavin-binding protein dodecin